MRMTTVSAVVLLVTAIPVMDGFISSRKQRSLDRRHLAAFVGFSAAIVALGAIMCGIIADFVWMRPPQSPHDHPVEQVFVAISSAIGLLSTGIAFFAGLCSSGSSRVTLVLFPLAMAVIWVLGAISNFGA